MAETIKFCNFDYLLEKCPQIKRKKIHLQKFYKSIAENINKRIFLSLFESISFSLGLKWKVKEQFQKLQISQPFDIEKYKFIYLYMKKLV